MKKITISGKIKDYRWENRLSQKDFGDLLGVSPQAVSKWEREECYPDITLLPKLAKILSCSEADFFEEDQAANVDNTAPI